MFLNIQGPLLFIAYCMKDHLLEYLAIYHYLITGNMEATMGKITTDDCSDKTSYIIKKVSELAIDKDSVSKQV